MMLDGLRSLFRAGHGIKVHLDEPAAEIAGTFATFRGWIAAETAIDSVVLEADGRVVQLTAALHDRPDVKSTLGARHVAGFGCSLPVGSIEQRPRSFPARLIVNGKVVLARRFTCVQGAEPEPSELMDRSDRTPWTLFHQRARRLGSTARVLEVGTRRTDTERSTHTHRLFPAVARENYLMCDVRPGDDVDVIADLHELPADWSGRFDAVVANAVFEHLERPWLATREIARVLAPGGFCHVSTHQTFPLHGHPSDYFRFSTEALRLVFEDAGLRVLATGYRNRTRILLPEDVMPYHLQDDWNRRWPSYAIVGVTVNKD
jgi:SAM-dependent methyltransferase